MLNENIKTIRKNKGFTQEELAVRLHVTRQTISKWEKGYSVPDAAMLSNIAEVLEVSIADLLGSEQVEKQDQDAIVEQLSRINEQLAVRNRRWRLFWKTVLIVFATIITTMLVTVIAGLRFYSFSDHDVAGSVSWECTLNGETYVYGITYNKDFQVLTGGGDAYIADNTGVEDCDDANLAAEKLMDYCIEKGGTVKVIEKSGLSLNNEAAIKNTFNGNLKTYHEMSDGTWQCEGLTYELRQVISGRLPNAAKDSTYVYLSNIGEISFEEAWKASGLSSSTNDYFEPEQAVLVDMAAD